METTESILWGTKVNDPDWMAIVISTKPENFKQATKWAISNGFNRLRISTIDITTKPDFTKAISF